MTNFATTQLDFCSNSEFKVVLVFSKATLGTEGSSGACHIGENRFTYTLHLPLPALVVLLL